MSLYEALVNFFGLLQLVIVARILLTWFPNINWWNQPFKFLREITDPMLEPLKRLIPPIGGIDLSPLVLLMIILPMVETIVLSLVRHFT